jgi:hypothetical protein
LALGRICGEDGVAQYDSQFRAELIDGPLAGGCRVGAAVEHRSLAVTLPVEYYGDRVITTHAGAWSAEYV